MQTRWFNMTKEQMKQLEWVMGEDMNCQIGVYPGVLQVSFETEDESFESYKFYDDGAVERILGTGLASNCYLVVEASQGGV